MTATGGTGGPYTFSATGLPAGLTMSTNGTISGTPTVKRHLPLHRHRHRFGTAIPARSTAPSPSPALDRRHLRRHHRDPGRRDHPRHHDGHRRHRRRYTFSATGLPTVSRCPATALSPARRRSKRHLPLHRHRHRSAGNKGTFNCSVTVSRSSATCVAINAIQGVPITPVTMTARAAPGTVHLLRDRVCRPVSRCPATAPSPARRPSERHVPLHRHRHRFGRQQGTFNCSVSVKPVVSATCVAIYRDSRRSDHFGHHDGDGGAGAPYTFSATGSADGLTMSSNGTVSGTPTQAARSPTPSPSPIRTATKARSIARSREPAVSATCVAIIATQGVPITSVTMTASGGAGAPYTFSATGLPNGLTMSSHGTISGTPTQSGTFPTPSR